MTDIWINDRARSICVALAAQEARTQDEVYTGAVRVGLNRYKFKEQVRVFDNGTTPPYRRITASDWTPSTLNSQVASVTVNADDLATANQIAADQGVHLNLVLSKALCTGLEALAGSEAYVGPFEAA